MFSRKEKFLLAALAFCVLVTGSLIPLGANWIIMGANKSGIRYSEYYNQRCVPEEFMRHDAYEKAFRAFSLDGNQIAPSTSKAQTIAQESKFCSLASQYIAARAAKATSYWSALSFTATAFGLILLWYTLALTRGALKEAQNTTKAAHAQIRPWMFVKKIDIVQQSDDYKIVIKFKNYGKTPATNFKREFSISNDPHPFEIRQPIYISNDFEISGVPPGKVMSAIMENFNVLKNDEHRTRIHISWSYDLHKEKWEDSNCWTVELINGKFHTRQVMPSDFKTNGVVVNHAVS